MLAFVSGSFAQSQGAGTIQGQMLNASTGSYLNNARVTLQGPTIEAFTDANGSYLLCNVPVGSALVSVQFVGFRSEQAVVLVVGGGDKTAVIWRMGRGARAGRRGVRSYFGG